jgi:threonine/homoserine/homoserine lactone efflux protein
VPFPDPGTLAVFAAAAVALLVIPGPAVLYIVSQSIEHGRTAGLVSMLGIQVGGLVHVAAAALGLSALLLQSATAFNIVKYAGAAYLIFLGLRKLLRRERFETTGERPPRRLDRLFAQGIVVNVLNPKTALFFFAFLPQFVDVGREPEVPAGRALGLRHGAGRARRDGGAVRVEPGQVARWAAGSPPVSWGTPAHHPLSSLTAKSARVCHATCRMRDDLPPGQPMLTRRAMR